MFDVHFDSKYYSEQLSHSMSVPNMACLTVAMVALFFLLVFQYIETLEPFVAIDRYLTKVKMNYLKDMNTWKV